MKISNYDNVLDSRAIIERIQELESEFADFLDATDGDDTESFPDIEELKTLRTLANDAIQYSSDWEFGEILIRYSYWENYIQEMLEDCGDIPADLPWYIAIDWETTADNISQDYSIVEFNGIDYYIRNT